MACSFKFVSASTLGQLHHEYLTMAGQSPREHNSAPREITEPVPSRSLSRAFVQALAGRLDLAALPLVQGPCGRQVLSQGETPNALPLVESGLLEAVVTLGGDGHRVVPVWFGPGEIALLSTLFSDERPRVELVWRVTGQLRWVPKVALEQSVQTHPPLALALLRFMAQRLREVQSRERVWLERGVHERVRAVLARAVATGGDGTQRIEITHEQLAEHCDVSRPKLSQALKVLERGGVLRLHRGAVEIISPALLRGADA